MTQDPDRARVASEAMTIDPAAILHQLVDELALEFTIAGVKREDGRTAAELEAELLDRET